MSSGQCDDIKHGQTAEKSDEKLVTEKNILNA